MSDEAKTLPEFEELAELVLLRLKKARDASGLTQGQVAERIGLSTSQVSRIEKGISRLTLPALFGYCRTLSISPATIVSSRALAASSEGELMADNAELRERIAALERKVSAAKSALAA